MLVTEPLVLGPHSMMPVPSQMHPGTEQVSGAGWEGGGWPETGATAAAEVNRGRATLWHGHGL